MIQYIFLKNVESWHGLRLKQNKTKKKITIALWMLMVIIIIIYQSIDDDIEILNGFALSMDFSQSPLIDW